MHLLFTFYGAISNPAVGFAFCVRRQSLNFTGQISGGYTICFERSPQFGALPLVNMIIKHRTCIGCNTSKTRTPDMWHANLEYNLSWSCQGLLAESKIYLSGFIPVSLIIISAKVRLQRLRTTIDAFALFLANYKDDE